MAADRDRIAGFCSAYLRAGSFKDCCANGLQVEGSRKVSRLISGVTLSQRLIHAAIERRAQMIIVHHGIFGEQIGRLPVISGPLRNRLKLLLLHDISLCGFHLPLDAHPRIGNNASLCRRLGLKKLLPVDIGFIGSLPKAVPTKSFTRLVEQRLSVKAQVIPAGPARVRRVCVISGGSSNYFSQAAAAGADTFICGDLRESVVRAVEEAGINLINAGHYNTEKLGIQNLGRLIARKFGIKADFVDVPCEV